MDQSHFQALDAAIEAGGTALPGKQIAGTGKTASALLKQLCAAGFLKEQKKKYSVTPEGRHAWEQVASPDRRQQVHGREEKRRREGLAAFIALLKKKGKKAITPKELTTHAAALREASDRHFVQPGEKGGSYRLLPAGEAFLLASSPPEQQVAGLRELQHDLTTRWSAALQQMQQDLDCASGEEPAAFEQLTNALKTKVEQAKSNFDSALTDFTAISSLQGVAQRLKESVIRPAETALRRLTEEIARLHACEERTQQAAAAQRAELEEFIEQFAGQLEALSRKLDSPARNPSLPTEGPDTASQPAALEVAVWQATRTAHEQLRRAKSLVKVPELTDEIMRRVPGVTPRQYHDQLQKWQREDRLVLQVCNNPQLEARAAEGINTERGLLFYVQIR